LFDMLYRRIVGVGLGIVDRVAVVRPVVASRITIANFRSAITMPKEAGRRRTKEEIRKKKKDPNAPKRALSAYMYFANEQRDTVRSENPGVSFGQIGKLLGEKWKSLTETDKAPYEGKATQDKKRYEEEKAAYTASKTSRDFSD
jgi:hypothetical protein